MTPRVVDRRNGFESCRHKITEFDIIDRPKWRTSPAQNECHPLPAFATNRAAARPHTPSSPGITAMKMGQQMWQDVFARRGATTD